VWLHKLKSTNLRHQAKTPCCHFFAVSVSRWGRVLRLPVAKVVFACYSRSSRSFLICLAWQQHKLAQVLNSNLITEWLYWRKFKLKKSHIKISTGLYAIQTLTKLQHCSVTQKQLCFYCRILLLALHIALICSATLLWSGAVT